MSKNITNSNVIRSNVTSANVSNNGAGVEDNVVIFGSTAQRIKDSGIPINNVIRNNDPGNSTVGTLLEWTDGNGILVQDSTITKITDGHDIDGVLQTDTEGSVVKIDTLFPLNDDKVQVKGSYFDNGIQVYSSLNTPSTSLTDVLWVKSSNNHLMHNAVDLEGASGDVVGPASSTTNAIPVYTDTTGKLLSNSTLTYDGTLLDLPTSAGISTAGAKCIRFKGSNTFIGKSVGNETTTGLNNIIIAGTGGTTPSATSMTNASFNTILGMGSAVNLTSGRFNVCAGHWAGDGITSGQSNLLLLSDGSGQLGNITTGSNNIRLGTVNGSTAEDMSAYPSSNGVIIGNSSHSSFAIPGLKTVSGTQGVTIDSQGLLGKANVGDVVGPASSTDNAVTRFDSTTGKLLQNSSVTISDTGVLNLPTSGAINYNGSSFLGTAASTTNSYVGFNSGNPAITGTFNTACGSQCGSSITSGNGNTCLGYLAGFVIEDGSNNILIGSSSGSDLDPSSSNNIYIGGPASGVESDTIRIGSAQTNAYLAGIYNNVVSSSQVVTVNSSGRLGSLTFANVHNNYDVTNVSSTPYNVAASDYLIPVDTSTLAITINLPAASTKRKLHIADASGNAASNNITISPNGGDTIAVSGTLLISTAYGYRNLTSDGVSKWYVS